MIDSTTTMKLPSSTSQPSQPPKYSHRYYYILSYICLVVGCGLSAGSLFTCNFLYVSNEDIVGHVENELIPRTNTKNNYEIDVGDVEKFKFGLFQSNFYLQNSPTNDECHDPSSNPECIVLEASEKCLSYGNIGFFIDEIAQDILYADDLVQQQDDDDNTAVDDDDDDTEPYDFQQDDNGPYQQAAFALGLLAVTWTIILVVMFTNSSLCDGTPVDVNSIKISIVVLLLAAIMEFTTLILFNHGLCKEVQCQFGPGSIMAISSSICLAASATLLLSLIRGPNDEHEDKDDEEEENGKKRDGNEKEEEDDDDEIEETSSN